MKIELNLERVTPPWSLDSPVRGSGFKGSWSMVDGDGEVIAEGHAQCGQLTHILSELAGTVAMVDAMDKANR